MSAPTYEDANVMLQLSRWAAQVGLEDASTFIWSDNFEEDYEAFKKKYPWGSQEQMYATRVCTVFETMAALWVNGLLNQKLISDWSAVDMVWDRIKNYALGVREQTGNPKIYEHFEALAKAIAA